MLWREVSPVSCSVLSLQVSCLLSLASMTWPTWPEPRPQCADWTARLLLHCRTLLELRKFKFEPKHFPECNRSNDQHLICRESPDFALSSNYFLCDVFTAKLTSLLISLSHCRLEPCLALLNTWRQDQLRNTNINLLQTQQTDYKMDQAKVGWR